MATPDEFRAAFGDKALFTFDPTVVQPLGLAEADAHWLISVGLPKSAAPFLSFGAKYLASLPTVPELIGFDLPFGNRYRVIGGNGSGDPVVIDLVERGVVAYLNHDNCFARVFINSSICQLADSLLAYHRLDEMLINKKVGETPTNGPIPSMAANLFISLLQVIDPPSLSVNSMWSSEIKEL